MWHVCTKSVAHRKSVHSGEEKAQVMCLATWVFGSLRARATALSKIEVDPAKIVQSCGEWISKSGILFAVNSFFRGHTFHRTHRYLLSLNQFSRLA